MSDEETRVEQGVQEMNMRMGQAQGVDAFVANMQHAQVTVADGPVPKSGRQAAVERV